MPVWSKLAVGVRGKNIFLKSCLFIDIICIFGADDKLIL
jgi:hypothetical protein